MRLQLENTVRFQIPLKMFNLNEVNICKQLVPMNYLELANQAQNSRNKAIKELLEKRKLPENGWPENQIEDFVRQLSMLDSNNFPHNLGFGEREARIYSSLVARRHYNFGHGIGRSGNLTESQPKAAGSTIMANLTNALLLDLLHSIGLKSCQSCLLVPMATGMTLMLCMLALKKQRPNAKYVLWSRIDQKSCFKSITSAGLMPIIIEPIIMGCTATGRGSNCTNVDEFEKHINQKGAENILCIFSTTSCFAPRSADDIILLAKLAKKYAVPHLVNNAYGLQCMTIVQYLERAQLAGRIDFFVQSTDKNLMVPVGGAIVASGRHENIQNVAQTYAGRASSTQTLDVLMTLLSLGKCGYQKLIDQRLQDFEKLEKQLRDFAAFNRTELLPTVVNEISIALNLGYLKNRNLTRFGSMLYNRGVSGARVIESGGNKTIDGYEFKNWGAHNSNFKGAYLTLAATIGMDAKEIERLCEKLQKCSDLFEKEQNKQQPNGGDIEEKAIE